VEEDEQTAWREHRKHAAAVHAAANAQRKAGEAAQARGLLAQFVEQARASGLTTTALTALAYNGRSRYRTGLHGWYLNRARSYAVTPEGDFYLLSAPTSVRDRVLGTTLTPTDPKLIIGEGARDGESIPLATLLAQRLEAGNDWG
jgi:hypothetical protein